MALISRLAASMKQDKSRSNMGSHIMDDSVIDRASDNEDDYDDQDEPMEDDYEEDEDYYDDYRPPPPNKRGRGGGMYRSVFKSIPLTRICLQARDQEALGVQCWPWNLHYSNTSQHVF